MATRATNRRNAYRARRGAGEATVGTMRLQESERGIKGRGAGPPRAGQCRGADQPVGRIVASPFARRLSIDRGIGDRTSAPGSGAGHRSGTVPDSHRLRDPAASKSTPMLARGEIRRACRLRQALRPRGSGAEAPGRSGWGRDRLQRRDLDLLWPRGPDQAEARDDEGESDTGEEAGHAQTQLQGRRGDRADAQLADQCVCRTGPRLLADCRVDRVRAVELRPSSGRRPGPRTACRRCRPCRRGR